MQIDPNIIKDQSDVVCVLIDGECNHADVNIETWDFGYPDASIGDYREDDRQVLVCTKCQAWRYNEQDSWEGITIMPVPHVFNNGKLVLR